jgi:hypothetical protein
MSDIYNRYDIRITFYQKVDILIYHYLISISIILHYVFMINCLKDQFCHSKNEIYKEPPFLFSFF